MARIKPQALLVQSKKKKGITRTSYTTSFLYILASVAVVLVLFATYKYWSIRSRYETGDKKLDYEGSVNNIKDSKKYDLPGFAILNTSKGSITVELNKDGSPRLVDKFLDLVQKDYFTSMSFHCVIKHFVIQGGHSPSIGSAQDWTGIEKLHAQLATSPKHEAFMLGTRPTKGNKEFELFITTAPIPDLNNKLLVFGRVIQGHEVVQEIEEVDTDEHFRPKSPVDIINVTLKQEI